MTINYNFEWDPLKARKNRNKHGVEFEEAATIFRDSKALSIFDLDHSETEHRWITMGISEKGRLLLRTILSEKKVERRSRSELFQAEKLQKMKQKNTVIKHEKRIRFFERRKRQVLSTRYET